MGEHFLAIFGIISAATNFAGLVPYVTDILKGKTKPERATWWIWLALGAIAFFAQVDAGAKWSLLMSGAQVLAVLLITILSIKHGYGTFSKKDKISLLVAAFGVCLWLLTKQPVLALLIIIAIDILALCLTLQKTWKSPETETYIAWVLAGFSGLFGILAVGELDFTKLIYPLYICLGNSLVAVVIKIRKR